MGRPAREGGGPGRGSADQAQQPARRYRDVLAELIRHAAFLLRCRERDVWRNYSLPEIQRMVRSDNERRARELLELAHLLPLSAAVSLGSRKVWAALEEYRTKLRAAAGLPASDAPAAVKPQDFRRAAVGFFALLGVKQSRKKKPARR